MIGSKKPFIGATLRVGSIKIRVTATSVEELNVIQLEAMKQMHEKLQPKNVRNINNCTDKNLMENIGSNECTIMNKKKKDISRATKIIKERVVENDLESKENESDTDYSSDEKIKAIENIARKINNMLKSTKRLKHKEPTKSKTVKELAPYNATKAENPNGGAPNTFHSISLMKEYEGLSFEEIRWMQMQALEEKEEIVTDESEHESEDTFELTQPDRKRMKWNE